MEQYGSSVVSLYGCSVCVAMIDLKTVSQYNQHDSVFLVFVCSHISEDCVSCNHMSLVSIISS